MRYLATGEAPPPARRAAARVLEDAVVGELDEDTVEKMFLLLLDPDGKVRFSISRAVSVASGVPSIVNPKFWIEAEPNQWEPVMNKWRKLWRGR